MQLARTPTGITHFSFWRPVAVSEFKNNPEETLPFAKRLWKMAFLADWYCSYNQEILFVKAKRINAHQINFQKQSMVADISLWVTALKVISCILSLGTLLLLKVSPYFLLLGTLPLSALIIKIIFKCYLNRVADIFNKTEMEGRIGKTKILLVSGSLTNAATDVIIEVANEAHLRDDESSSFLPLKCGEAVLLTSAGRNLKGRVKAIAYTAWPNNSQTHSSNLIADAYRNPLKLMFDRKNHAGSVNSELIKEDVPLRSISYPCLGGKLNFLTALQAITEFIKNNPNANANALEEIHFVCPPSHQGLLSDCAEIIQSYCPQDGEQQKT